MKGLQMMNNLMNDWYIYMAILAVFIVAIWLVYRFFCLPTEKQLVKVTEWLVWACTKAESELQSGTGKIKLRKVYDAFVSINSFSWIARIISFEKFSEMVKDALKEMKKNLIENPKLAEYVYGDNWETEVEKLKEQMANDNQ